MKTDLNLIKTQKANKQRRQFFVGLGIVLAALGGWYVYRERMPTGPILIGAGIVLIVCELFVTKASIALFKAWMGLAKVLGLINTVLILSLIYFFIVWPLAIFRKISQRKVPVLEDTFRKKHSSWIELTPSTYGPERYYRPF